jgi:hypothetical protein
MFTNPKFSPHFTYSSWSLNNELYDDNSIVEQFHAALRLGPSVIFIDGIMENKSESQPIKLSHWLPPHNDTKAKFVITLRRATKLFSDLSDYKSAVVSELTVFNGEDDYNKVYSKILSGQKSNLNPSDTRNNTLYSKYRSIFGLFSVTTHSSNPLFVQLIGKELSCFDNEIYKGNSMFHRRSTASTMLSDLSESSAAKANDVIDSYFEDVSTIREIIQKIISRYLAKRYNWTLKAKAGYPLSESK